MSFGKSGGLSINTGGANSLFGGGAASSTSQPASGGLFGSSTSTPASSQPQSGGGLFGGALNKPATQTGGSLFGGSTPASSAGGGGGGGGGLFGSSTATASSQPQQSGSMFGGALGQNNQQQPQQQSGSLFGGAGQTQQQSSTPSLFGSSTTAQNQQQQQPKPSLFGSSTTTSQPQTGGGGLFGTSTMNTNQQQQQPASGGLFGTSTAQPANASTNTVPGVRIDLSNIRGSTRFNDLHEDLQKQIEQMDALIQQQISHHDQCAAFIDGRMKENLAYVPADVDFIASKTETVETALDNDSRAIAALKETFKHDAENARITFRVLENLKLPTQFHYTGSMWTPAAAGAAAGAKDSDLDALASDEGNTDLVAFFQAQATALDTTLDTQARLLAEIEQHLRTVEASTLHQTQELLARRGGAAGDGDAPAAVGGSRLRDLALLFSEIQRAILNEAAKVGDCREKVVETTMGIGGAPTPGMLRR